MDHLTLISSLADIGSSFFGGAPVESIISATANAPHPVWAGVAMMVVVGVILLSGLLPKIGNYVPSSSIAGFLFVLGCSRHLCWMRLRRLRLIRQWAEVHSLSRQSPIRFLVCLPELQPNSWNVKEEIIYGKLRIRTFWR